MDEFECAECHIKFISEERLQQHNRDKHGIEKGISGHNEKHMIREEKKRQAEAERKRSRKAALGRRAAYVAVPLFLLAIVFGIVFSQPPDAADASVQGVPGSPVHWHPRLEIFINGQEYPIPVNLGAEGSVHFPVHTHGEGDGTLHYEVNNPTQEVMQLRYFFERVWRKPFNSMCIFEYCSGDSGTLRMYVNGEENHEFENYIPRDNDEIRIEFS